MGDTKTYLAAELRKVAEKATPERAAIYRALADRAETGEFDDYGDVHICGPTALHNILRANGMDKFARRVASGEFDASLEESEAWALDGVTQGPWAAAIEAAAQIARSEMKKRATAHYSNTSLDKAATENAAAAYCAGSILEEILSLTPPADIAPLLAARDKRVREQALREAAAEAAGEVAAHGLAEIAPFLRRSILALHTPESRAIAEGGAE